MTEAAVTPSTPLRGGGLGERQLLPLEVWKATLQELHPPGIPPTQSSTHLYAPQLLSESQGHMAHLVNSVSDVLDALQRDRGLARPHVTFLCVWLQVLCPYTLCHLCTTSVTWNQKPGFGPCTLVAVVCLTDRPPIPTLLGSGLCSWIPACLRGVRTRLGMIGHVY